MFKHVYFNSLKIFIREKNVVFWLLIFPMILSVFFKMAFSGLLEEEQFEVIEVAVIEEQGFADDNSIYKMVFNQLGDFFNFTYTTDEEAKALLEQEKVSAYVYVDNGLIAMTIADNGIDQSILKEVLDSINEGIVLVNNGGDIQSVMSESMNVKNVLNNISMSGKTQDTITAYFYTVLGMAAMYGSMLGVMIIKYIQANQSPNAMRFNIAPVSKMKGFLAMYTAGVTLHSIILIVIYIYLRNVMKIDFGDRYLYVILTTVVGGLTGVSIGGVISVIVKKNENFKIGVCICVSMVFSYLSGMMDSSVKYKVMQSVPALEKINPASLMTDAYLKLYYYEDLNVYWDNIVNLIAITAVCICITIFVLRRQQYDSI